MTHPTPTDPLCPTCGYEASAHRRLVNHEITGDNHVTVTMLFDEADEEACDRLAEDVIRAALAAVQGQARTFELAYDAISEGCTRCREYANARDEQLAALKTEHAELRREWESACERDRNGQHLLAEAQEASGAWEAEANAAREMYNATQAENERLKRNVELVGMALTQATVAHAALRARVAQGEQDTARWQAARTFSVKMLYGAHDGWSYDGDADQDADFTIAMDEAGRRGVSLTREAWAADAARGGKDNA